MKIAYISCFTAPEPSLSEYSYRFAEIVGQLDEIELVMLDLSGWHMRSGRQVFREVRECLDQFRKREGEFDCFHFELVNHHLMVWAAILAKANLRIPGRVIVTLHDPPLPVHGALGLFLPEGKLSHYMARLADVIVPKFVFQSLASLIDGAMFLTKAGEEAFLKKWSGINNKTIVIPHVPFKLPEYLQKEWELEPKKAKSADEPIEVFFAGLWWKHKGIEELIRAVSLLNNEGKKVRLVISGTGPASYVKKIDTLLSELSHQGVEVEKPGHLEREELYRRGHQADCWVVPYQKTSKVSASGILCRAIAAQTSVIVSHLPQFKEFVSLGVKHCHLYPCGDFKSLSKLISNSREDYVGNTVSHLDALDSDFSSKVEELLKVKVRKFYSGLNA